MTQQKARSNALVLAVIGLLCVSISDRPTAVSAIAGGVLLIAAAALVAVGQRLPSPVAEPLELSDDEVLRWRSLAQEQGTVTAVKQLRQSHPGLGLVEAVHIVDGEQT